jgi:hypothetical protein
MFGFHGALVQSHLSRKTWRREDSRNISAEVDLDFKARWKPVKTLGHIRACQLVVAIGNSLKRTNIRRMSGIRESADKLFKNSDLTSNSLPFRAPPYPSQSRTLRLLLTSVLVTSRLNPQVQRFKKISHEIPIWEGGSNRADRKLQRVQRRIDSLSARRIENMALTWRRIGESK